MFGSQRMPLWLSYLARGVVGHRRYVCATPPTAKTQRVYDRSEGKWHRFHIRDDDDWIQIEHIFLNEEFNLAKTGRSKAIDATYRRIADAGRAPLILDLGANIGLASAYFAEAWPKARIISVEPDPGNCALARRNLPHQAELVEAAVASRAGSAELIDTGRNCGFQVNPEQGGSIPLVTVNDLLAMQPDAEPFIVKIDIEGFEEDLFATQIEWIDRFPILLIELHDWLLPGKRVTKNVLKALAERDREFVHYEGYVVSMALSEDLLREAVHA